MYWQDVGTSCTLPHTPGLLSEHINPAGALHGHRMTSPSPRAFWHQWIPTGQFPNNFYLQQQIPYDVTLTRKWWHLEYNANWFLRHRMNFICHIINNIPTLYLFTLDLSFKILTKEVSTMNEEELFRLWQGRDSVRGAACLRRSSGKSFSKGKFVMSIRLTF